MNGRSSRMARAGADQPTRSKYSAPEALVHAMSGVGVRRGAASGFRGQGLGFRV